MFELEHKGASKYKKFTKGQRRAIRKVISGFLAKEPKATQDDIGEHLNSKNVAHVNAPQWTRREVGNFLVRNRVTNRKQRRSPRKYVRADMAPPKKAESKGDKIDIAEIILSSTLENDKKGELLMSLFQDN